MNRIHGTAIIGDGVELGTGNVVGPHTVILGPCQLGDDNWIGPHVVIGTPGEVRGGAHPAAWDGESGVGPIVIGDRNTIREFTTVQQGQSATTRIGNDCYIMTKAHVPHDGVLGDRVTLSCSVMVGGHSFVGDGANVGLGTVIHQRLAIGAGAMVGMGSVVTKHIPPYATAFGNPCKVRSANRVGLERAGFSADVAEQIEAAILSGDEALLSSLLVEDTAAFAREVELLSGH